MARPRHRRLDRPRDLVGERLAGQSAFGIGKLHGQAVNFAAGEERPEFLPFLAWLGGEGRGRALSVGEVKFSGMVQPHIKLIEYGVDLKRIVRSKLVLGIGDGWLKADGEPIYHAANLRVGLFKT